MFAYASGGTEDYRRALRAQDASVVAQGDRSAEGLRVGETKRHGAAARVRAAAHILAGVDAERLEAVIKAVCVVHGDFSEMRRGPDHSCSGLFAGDVPEQPGRRDEPAGIAAVSVVDELAAQAEAPFLRPELALCQAGTKQARGPAVADGHEKGRDAGAEDPIGREPALSSGRPGADRVRLMGSLVASACGAARGFA